MTVAIYIIERTYEGYLSGRFVGPDDQFDDKTSLSEEQILIYPGAFSTSLESRSFPKSAHEADFEFPEFGPGDLIVANDAVGWPMRPQGEKEWKLGLKLANSVNVFEKGLVSEREALRSYSLYLQRKADTEHAVKTELRLPMIKEREKTLTDLYREAYAIASRDEKDELLVLSYLDENEDLVHETVLHTGSTFFHMAEVASASLGDLGIEKPEKPGLYALIGGDAYAYPGDSGWCADFGVNGDLEEITIEKAAEHFEETVEQILIEISGQYPYEPDGDILEAIKTPARNPIIYPLT